MKTFASKLLILGLVGGGLCAENRLISRPTGQVKQYTGAESYAAMPQGMMQMSVRQSVPTPLVVGEREEEADLPTASGRSYSVEIVHVQDTSVPSLAADLNANLMSSELINQLEGEYKRQLDDYNNNYNFYITRRDSRGARPYGLSSSEDAALRHRMARRSMKYMMVKGFPNFLKSRPDTKDVGKVADDAIQFAEKAATFDIETKSGWRYNTGFNPIEMKLFARAAKDTWSFQANSSIKDARGPYPWSRKNPLKFAMGKGFGSYGFEVRYNPWDKFQELAMSHPF